MGGTGTRVCLLQEPDQPQRWTDRGGNLALDADNVIHNIVALVRETGPEAACLGLAGARTAPDARARLEAAIAPFTNRAVVMSDADLALETAFGPDEDGIVICAGTGTVAVARLAGATHVVGGHGFLYGDEGGGFAIGRQLISETLRCRDLGRPDAADLVAQVETLLGMPLDDFVVETYRTFGNRAALAALATTVGTLHHPAAEHVVTCAATAVVRLGRDARSRFGDLPIRFTGGVFRVPAMAQAVREALNGQPVTAPAADAAAHVAAHLAAAP